MSTSRRNVIIRSVAAVCGDIAVGLAMASACTWLIESAALGMFMSFVVWLLGTILSFALSQYLVHPAVSALLCDRKLDAAVDLVSNLGQVLDGISAPVLLTVWDQVSSLARRSAPSRKAAA